MAYKGRYTPKNPEKYVGDPTKIKYLSLWERNCMKAFDDNPNILLWSAPTGGREFAIKYRSPIDGEIHRYLPDFLIKLQTKSGDIKRILVEVKPLAQCNPPKLPKSGRKTKQYCAKRDTWYVNKAKWDAAKAWCERNGYVFKIMTEAICT